jgi:RNA polymerase sigma-70 factor (ECF subfamily)
MADSQLRAPRGERFCHDAMRDLSTTDRPGSEAVERELEQHRAELTGYCYRMLASPFEAEDAVQETFIRAWRAHDRFEGRSSLRSWLYRIATNVCLDMLSGSERRARPMDLGPAVEPDAANLHVLSEASWIQPAPDGRSCRGRPGRVAVTREGIKLAFIAALSASRQAAGIAHPARRPALEGERGAELLDTSVASLTARQRARAAGRGRCGAGRPQPPLVGVPTGAHWRATSGVRAVRLRPLTSLIRRMRASHAAV